MAFCFQAHLFRFPCHGGFASQRKVSQVMPDSEPISLSSIFLTCNIIRKFAELTCDNFFQAMSVPPILSLSRNETPYFRNLYLVLTRFHWPCGLQNTLQLQRYGMPVPNAAQDLCHHYLRLCRDMPTARRRPGCSMLVKN